jgi:2EXR family
MVSKPNLQMPQPAKPTSEKEPKPAPENEPKAVLKKEPKTPKRLYTFKFFSCLPIELRVIIWTFAANTPRLVRAKWASNTEEIKYSIVYELSTSPQPGLFRACYESRNVAKKFYSIVPQHVVFHGQILFKDTLWINFKADTFYFTNFPERAGFLRTLRKLKGYSRGKGVQSIAFSTKELWRLLECPHPSVHGKSLPALIYDVVQENQLLRDIMVVAGDKKNFAADSNPGKYGLHALGKSYKPETRLCPVPALRLGRREPAVMIPKAFDFDDPIPNGQKMPSGEKEKFKKFKKNNPTWREPEFTYKKVLKK